MADNSLITEAQHRQMLVNGHRSSSTPEHDPMPVVRLYVVGGNALWLLAEVDPDDPDVAFGLCDPGDGFPTLGTVRLSALEGLAERGMIVARDTGFVATSPISRYAEHAYRSGRIE